MVIVFLKNVYSACVNIMSDKVIQPDRIQPSQRHQSIGFETHTQNYTLVRYCTQNSTVVELHY